MTKDVLPPPPTRDDGPMLPRAAATPSAPHSATAVDTLKQAMRRARLDNAERASVMSDLRTARLGRLELLHEALKPLVAQIPADVDTFDIGLLPSSNPRLFIDMIGFVEMGRDARQYRLLQDTRTGRISLADSEDLDTMVDAVTDYVARRLLERDKALAADTPPGAGADSRSGPIAAAFPTPARSRPPRAATVAKPRPAPPRPRGFGHVFAIAFSFLIDLLGSIALFTALTMVAWYVWNRLHIAI